MTTLLRFKIEVHQRKYHFWDDQDHYFKIPLCSPPRNSRYCRHGLCYPNLLWRYEDHFRIEIEISWGYIIYHNLLSKKITSATFLCPDIKRTRNYTKLENGTEGEFWWQVSGIATLSSAYLFIFVNRADQVKILLMSSIHLHRFLSPWVEDCCEIQQIKYRKHDHGYIRL